MSAIPVPVNAISVVKKSGKAVEILKDRASQEFIIAVMGAVGCGLPRIVTEFDEQLTVLGYKVIRIKLSTFISDQISKAQFNIPDSDRDNRYLRSQTGGNELRKSHGNEVMAKYAINQIGRHRLTIDQELKDLAKEPPRIAYIIDQIKHPDEVALLRTVYRNNFYLVGVMSLEASRRSRLGDDGIKAEVIESIVNRDRKESDKYGQQLEKAFKLADYFLHHPLGDPDALVPKQVKRFLDLVHGDNGITPTSHEYAMYIAYSTAMKSSCLSRQVGAAITDKSNRVVAVGTNDVPQYRGGLYSAENPLDDRCFKNRKICENNAEKKLRKAKIRTGIESQFSKIFPDPAMSAIASEKIDEIVEIIFEQSGIPDLIEFSRAVHAEMDALISLSRGGGGSTVGAKLYATTFPCHNCARHIIAAGIDRVYYIEPYEKSLAPAAHNDAIEVLDHDDDVTQPSEKLKFVHFSGVGPRIYPEFFLRESGRKDDEGKFIPHGPMKDNLPTKIIMEFIDSYRTFEVAVAGLFEEEFPTEPPMQPPIKGSPSV